MARYRFVLPVALSVLLLVMLGALGAGRYAIAPVHIVQALAGGGDATTHVVVWQARLPRLLAAAMIGAGLAVSGATYQAVFRNPLVAPDLLGVLSGAAFGAASAILLGASGAGVQAGAFGGGILAMATGLGVARLLGGGGLLALVLGGLIANAIFTALVSLMKYVADPQDQLPAIVYWLLGSLAQVGWGQIVWLTPALVLALVPLLAAGRIMDVLSLDDDEARSLGVPARTWRLAAIGFATFLAALTVSVAGIIGWVGLLTPHLARLLVGAPHRRMVPLSAVLGAVGVVLADTVARTATPGEIPLGMLTELFGAVAFVLVLRRLRQDVA